MGNDRVNPCYNQDYWDPQMCQHENLIRATDQTGTTKPMQMGMVFHADIKPGTNNSYCTSRKWHLHELKSLSESILIRAGKYSQNRNLQIKIAKKQFF